MVRTIGTERERFIINEKGQIVPFIGVLLPRICELAMVQGLQGGLFSPELFAGQIEDRTLPCRSLEELRVSLMANDRLMEEGARQINLAFDCSEVVEVSRITTLEVNPFDQRHQQIWQSISIDRKIAASIVAAVHVHLSASEDEAVKVLNLCRKNVIERLIELGDHSSYKRINAYRIMAATDGIPPMFSCFSEVSEYIRKNGGEKNIWDLVRYKPSTKTLEFRMFGATGDIEEVIGYVEACLDVFSA